MKVVNIPKPTSAIVRDYLEKWNTLESYVLQEKSLWLLFREAYPKNKKIEHILIKASCLNDFYGTNIFSIFTIAKHILDLDIDKYLATGDDEVVNKISKVTMPNGKIRNCYSFASKYCSHHWPERYPIYDYYVEKILLYFQKQENFSSFQKKDLKDYQKFMKILGEFKEFFNLAGYSLKDIDRYLWQVGREFFPRKYY